MENLGANHYVAYCQNQHFSFMEKYVGVPLFYTVNTIQIKVMM